MKESITEMLARLRAMNAEGRVHKIHFDIEMATRSAKFWDEAAESARKEHGNKKAFFGLIRGFKKRAQKAWDDVKYYQEQLQKETEQSK